MAAGNELRVGLDELLTDRLVRVPVERRAGATLPRTLPLVGCRPRAALPRRRTRAVLTWPERRTIVAPLPSVAVRSVDVALTEPEPATTFVGAARTIPVALPVVATRPRPLVGRTVARGRPIRPIAIPGSARTVARVTAVAVIAPIAVPAIAVPAAARPITVVAPIPVSTFAWPVAVESAIPVGVLAWPITVPTAATSIIAIAAVAIAVVARPIAASFTPGRRSIRPPVAIRTITGRTTSRRTVVARTIPRRAVAARTIPGRTVPARTIPRWASAAGAAAARPTIAPLARTRFLVVVAPPPISHGRCRPPQLPFASAVHRVCPRR
jgi:hypothetical protein